MSWGEAVAGAGTGGERGKWFDDVGLFRYWFRFESTAKRRVLGLTANITPLDTIWVLMPAAPASSSHGCSRYSSLQLQ